MKTPIAFVFLCMSFIIAEINAQQYLIIENDEYELLDSRPWYTYLPNSNLCYELTPGYLPKKCSVWKSSQLPSMVNLVFHIEEGLVGNDLYPADFDVLIEELNDLAGSHFHPYRYSYTKKNGISDLDSYDMTIPSASCDTGKEKKDPLTELDIYVLALHNETVLTGAYHASSIPEFNLILSRPSIMMNYGLLAHEIYHQLEPLLCDNKHVYCDGNPRNILNESGFYCNHLLDVFQLRKIIDPTFYYNADDQLPSNHLKFPKWESCLCVAGQYPYDELTHGEQISNAKILNDPKIENFILKNFTTKKHSKSFEQVLPYIKNKKEFRSKFNMSEKEMERFLKRKRIATKSLMHDNIVLLLRNGLRQRNEEAFKAKYKKVTDIKTLFYAYYGRKG